MSTSDLTVTLVGWVGTEPKHYTGTGVTPFTSFRMANTRRYFDRAQSTWTDGRTEWFTVKVWRQSAINVASSLHKGDPVLVHGRLSTEQWDGPDGPRTTLVLEALAIGPDLTYGRASFARTVHVTGPGAGEAGEGADPADGAAEGDGSPGTDGGDDPWASDGLGGPGDAAPDDAGAPDDTARDAADDAADDRVARATA
jgi:single-strand DNA-binding protein